MHQTSYNNENKSTSKYTLEILSYQVVSFMLCDNLV